MGKYEIPATPKEREDALVEQINSFTEDISLFRDKQRKNAGNRARGALTTIRKLITFVRKDLAEEIKTVKKEAKEDAAVTPAPEVPAADATPETPAPAATDAPAT